MADSMLSNRSWLPGFLRKIFMPNSESTRYDRREKRESAWFQNRLRKRRDGYGLKDQIHGALMRQTGDEVFDGKIERVWKRKEMKWLYKERKRKQRQDLVFRMYIWMYIIECNYLYKDS